MSRSSRREFLVGAGALAASTACMHTRILEASVGVPAPRTLRDAWNGLRGDAPSSTGLWMFPQNKDAWAVRWHWLSNAQRRIDASYFIIEGDAFGMAFLGRLLERAEAGVRVRLLIDARGSQPLTLVGRDHLQELVQSGGVDVRVFNPLAPQLFNAIVELDVLPLASASHNKILVIDDIAVTGGRNISRLYYSTFDEEASATGDCDIVVDGRDLVEALDATMMREFHGRERGDVKADVVNLVSRRDELLLMARAMDIWLSGAVRNDLWAESAVALEAAAVASMGRVVDDSAVEAVRPQLEMLVRAKSVWGTLPLRPHQRYAVESRLVASAARVDHVDDDVNDAFVRAIGGARRSIWLESPYFIPTQRVLKALQRASDDGVAITLLTNSPLSSDNDVAQAFFVDSWPEIVARVPTLRVFAQNGHHMIHGKRAVFDDVLTFVGTYNIDPFSSLVNSELFVASWSAELAERNRTDLEERTGNGSMVEYRIAYNKDGSVARAGAATDRPGAVLVERGPDDDTPADKMVELRRIKRVLVATRAAWSFDTMVW